MVPAQCECDAAGNQRAGSKVYLSHEAVVLPVPMPAVAARPKVSMPPGGRRAEEPYRR